MLTASSASSALAMLARTRTVSIRRSLTSSSGERVVPVTARDSSRQTASSPSLPMTLSEDSLTDPIAAQRRALVRAATAVENTIGSAPAATGPIEGLTVREARLSERAVFRTSKSGCSFGKRSSGDASTLVPPEVQPTLAASEQSRSNTANSAAWADRVLIDSYAAMRSAVHLSAGLQPPISSSTTSAGVPALQRSPAPLTPDVASRVAAAYSVGGSRLDPEELVGLSPNFAVGSTLGAALSSFGFKLAAEESTSIQSRPTRARPGRPTIAADTSLALHSVFKSKIGRPIRGAARTRAA